MESVECQKRTVLVVEDDADTREMFAQALSSKGYLVQEARNGEEALHMLEEGEVEPCLVLLDMMMPVMSGTELMLALSRHDRLSAIPVIVCSAAQADGEERANYVIRKPVGIERLLDLVADYCGTAR